MIVPSPQFLGFAAAAAAFYHLASALRWRQTVLLAANLLFLLSFSHDPLALAPFAGFLLVGYCAYRFTRGGSRPALFVAVLVLTLLIFCWLKRYSFIPGIAFLPFPYLLVGLSYVFFRVMHVIIDGHQDAIDEPIGWLSYLNYTLNFTSLVSGPIQRYQDYSRMEATPAPLTLADAGRAVERIVLGYFKISIVGMVLLTLQHRAISSLATTAAPGGRVLDTALVVALYPVFLYFNFSGYIDFVHGVARFFGIDLPENFDRPFSSENFLTFWSRWHITLSNWLKTYVYNPLMMAGLARITRPTLAPYVAVFGFFVTFFLVGMWHGQTSEFIFFGVTQGGGVALNKLYQIVAANRLGRAGYRALCSNPVYIAASRGLTFTWFAVTLLWFWSNWTQIGGFAATLGSAGTVLACLTIFVGATLVLAAKEALRTSLLRVSWRVDPGSREPVLLSRYLRTAWSTALVVVTVGVNFILASPAPDIVYRTF